MQTLLRYLLKILGVAGIFVTFVVSIFGAAGVVARLGILNEDFMLIFMGVGMLVGAGGMAWGTGLRKPKEPVLHLWIIGLFLLMGAVPAGVALINVRLDRTPATRHVTSVVYANGQGERCRCAVRDDVMGVFWVTLPSGRSAGPGSQVEVAIRPGLLGFAWIERVGPEPAPSGAPPRYSAPPSPPAVEMPDAESTPVER